jgi:AraC-like DNA-binding protein
MGAAPEPMVRKQFMMSRAAIARLEQIAAERGISSAEVVRQAIAAFDSSAAQTLDSSELMDLVSTRLQEAIHATRDAERRVSDVLEKLSAQGVR